MHTHLFPTCCRNMFQITSGVRDYNQMLTILEAGDFLFIDNSSSYYAAEKDHDQLHAFLVEADLLNIHYLLYQPVTPYTEKLYASFHCLL